MSDREEELDLDRPEIAKVLLGEKAVKKKAKAKTKRKPKEEGEVKISAKNMALLPLSMQTQSSEDAALFEGKIGALKGHGTTGTKPYSPTERYKQTDVINHKKFGVGFVVQEHGLNKIEVLFKTGRKMLMTAAAKTQSLLKSLHSNSANPKAPASNSSK